MLLLPLETGQPPLVFTRWHAEGRRLFKIVGTVFLLFSLAAPLTSGADGATQLILLLMHLVAGGFILSLLGGLEQ